MCWVFAYILSKTARQMLFGNDYPLSFHPKTGEEYDQQLCSYSKFSISSVTNLLPIATKTY